MAPMIGVYQKLFSACICLKVRHAVVLESSVLRLVFVPVQASITPHVMVDNVLSAVTTCTHGGFPEHTTIQATIGILIIVVIGAAFILALFDFWEHFRAVPTKEPSSIVLVFEEHLHGSYTIGVGTLPEIFHRKDHNYLFA
jgi:hypothetical protein